eukprot:gene27043-33705_t
MNLELRQLRYFAAVAEELHFGRAAQRLHMTQPPLTQAIALLERLLGVRLFDRTTRSVSLTVLGQQFLGEVRGLVADLDRSVLSLRDAAELEAGDVTVGCVFSAVHPFLPPVIRAVRERCPRVLVRIIEEGADEVLASVKHGEADFAINYIGMQDPDVSFTPLLKEPYVLACPVGHPLARRRSIKWEELAQYPLARVSHASRNRLFIDQALAELPPLPRPIIEVRHVSTLIGLVESGLGLAVVAQGGKQVTAGEQVLDYGMGQSLLITADLPVVAHVTRADVARPFMCLFL